LKVTFLGTGTSQGVPVIACPCRVCASHDNRDHRLRTSVMIESGGKVIVIDAGPDFRQQMLRENVKRLDALLLTHEHKDHIAGLDDIRAFNYVNKSEVDVYASQRVQDALKREFAYVFSGDNYPGIPKIALHLIDESSLQVAGNEIIPIEVMHYQLPVWGFRLKDFCYITDANHISDHQKSKMRNLKVLVINALRIEKHISHFTLSEAISLIEELRPERAYLTHISHQLGLHADVEAALPDHIRCAYDGLRITL